MTDLYVQIYEYACGTRNYARKINSYHETPRSKKLISAIISAF